MTKRVITSGDLLFESIEVFPGNAWVQEAVPAMIGLAKRHHCKVWCDWPVAGGARDVRLEVVHDSNADDVIEDWYKRAGGGRIGSKP